MCTVQTFVSIRRYVLVLIAALTLAGCSSSPSSVDYRTDYAFNSLQSFFILPVDESVYANPKVSHIAVERIKTLLGEELSKRYSAADEKSADFLVRYFLVMEDRMRVESYNTSFGMYRSGYGYHYGLQSPNVKNTYYQQGSIIIDIIDAKTDEVVWRGSTEGKVKEKLTPEQQDERIRAYLAELFTKFPPAQGTK